MSNFESLSKSLFFQCNLKLTHTHTHLPQDKKKDDDDDEMNEIKRYKNFHFESLNKNCPVLIDTFKFNKFQLDVVQKLLKICFQKDVCHFSTKIEIGFSLI